MGDEAKGYFIGCNYGILEQWNRRYGERVKGSRNIIEILEYKFGNKMKVVSFYYNLPLFQHSMLYKDCKLLFKKINLTV